jgi:hypothetical protein
MIDSNDGKLEAVLWKLSAISDFFKILNDPAYVLNKDTPDGLYIMTRECIDTLKTIGGLHERSNR